MSRYDITQAYMMVGGIPYYLKYFKKEYSLSQNINAISTKDKGITRAELTKMTGITDSGELSRRLNALMAGDFIIKYNSFGDSKRNENYKLIDPFCIFYLTFVNGSKSGTSDWWSIDH